MNLDWDDEAAGRRACLLLGKDPERDWREVDQPGGGIVILDVIDPAPKNWQHYARIVRRAVEAGTRAGAGGGAGR